MVRLRNTVREETLAETRRLLLEAAIAEFAKEGYASANINTISQAAGFAKGTVYNHFPSKQVLMQTLIDEIAADHTAFIVRQVEPEPSPIQRLTRFFSAGFDFIESYPARARVIVTTVYGPDAEFRARVYRAYEPLFALIIRDILATGIGRGDFRTVNTDLIAALIMSIYLGACSQFDSGGKIWLDPNQVALFILDGLRPRVASV